MKKVKRKLEFRRKIPINDFTEISFLELENITKEFSNSNKISLDHVYFSFYSFIDSYDDHSAALDVSLYGYREETDEEFVLRLNQEALEKKEERLRKKELKERIKEKELKELERLEKKYRKIEKALD